MAMGLVDLVDTDRAVTLSVELKMVWDPTPYKKAPKRRHMSLVVSVD
jgi:hypothetical protein